MKLLRFGDTTINIARAIRINDSGSSIEIDFVASGQVTLPTNIRFEGKDAAALRRWIAANAEDMSSLEPADTGEPLDDPKSYRSPR